MIETAITSWPFAVMFIATLASLLALYVVRWWKKSDEQDKAYRASTAVTVRRDPYSDNG